MKIRSAGADLFHAHGQIDVTKIAVAFRHFANAPLQNRLHTNECILKLSNRPRNWSSEI
jgi:hypothetical protein